MADQGTQPHRFEVRPTSDSHFGWLRTRLSVERTLMSWVRTSVALAAMILAAPVAASAQTAPSNTARAALAALERQGDALFAAAAKRDWTGAKIALDAAKGGVDVLRTQRFVGAYADAGGRMEALYAAATVSTPRWPRRTSPSARRTARPRCAAPTG